MKPFTVFLTIVFTALTVHCPSPSSAQEQFETLEAGPLPATPLPRPAPFAWRRDSGETDGERGAAPAGRSPLTIAGQQRLRRPASLSPLFPPPDEELARRRLHEEWLHRRRRPKASPRRGAAIQSVQEAVPADEFLSVKATPVYLRNWTLQAGQEYLFETRHLSPDGDTVLYLLYQGRQIARNNDRADDDPSSSLRFTPEVTGAYTVLIRALDESRGGTCDLFIDGQVRQQEITFGGAVVPWTWQPGDHFQTAHLPSTYARSVDTILFAFQGLDLVDWNDNGGINGCSSLGLESESDPGSAQLLIGSASQDLAETDWVMLYRNALSQGDSDGDTLADPLEASLGTDPERIDTDSDGLRDDWELFGVRTPNGEEDLPSYAGTGIHKRRGADPRVPDLFLEIDWMAGPKPHLGLFRPLDAALDLVTRQFWTSGGIVLHIDLGQMGTRGNRGGQVLPYQESFDRTGTEPLSLESCYASGDWFSLSRRHLFAYIICSSRFPDRTSSGHMVRFNEDGSINQTSLFNSTLQPAAIVSMGTSINGVLAKEAGTIMHELGHCLNLQHGGFESFNNFKPNYCSSMNYLFQFGGLDDEGAPDYSHGRNAPLDERLLDERTGVGPVAEHVLGLVLRGRTQPAISRRADLRTPDLPLAFDWDGDGRVNPVRVRVDFNADGWYGPLRDHDDWAEVRRPDRGTLWVGVNASVEGWTSSSRRH